MGKHYWEKFTEEQIKQFYYSSKNTKEFCIKLGYKSSNGLAIEELKEKYTWFQSYSTTKNEVGNKYGRLTVIEQDKSRTDRDGAFWICKCDCGNIVSVSGSALRKGNTQSCGCYNREQSSKKFLIDLTGQKFGKWTVLKRAENNTSSNGSKWICQCSCDKHTIKEIDSLVLRRGESLSCGCNHKSQGEYLIEKILDELGIKYQEQFILNKKSVNNGKLVSDFVLFINNQPKLIIEFNGKQHYEPVEIFGREEYFKTLTSNDKLKKEYCEENNIDFLVFNYEELKDLNSIYFKNKLFAKGLDITQYDLLNDKEEKTNGSHQIRG